MFCDVDYVLAKLDWMRAEHIWPNRLRYLWTDAFGVVLYLSLYRETGEQRWLDAAEELVGEVDRVLGRPRGYCIGEAPDRDGQYFHYLAMWLFALARLADIKPCYRAKGIAIAKAIHPAFVLPGRGVIWKMEEDLSKSYPGCGLGRHERVRWVYLLLPSRPDGAGVRNRRHACTDRAAVPVLA